MANPSFRGLSVGKEHGIVSHPGRQGFPVECHLLKRVPSVQREQGKAKWLLCGEQGDEQRESGQLLRLEMNSDPENLCIVRAAVERAAEVLKFSEGQSHAIVRSVDEALANVIRHAYGGRSGEPIAVTCSRLVEHGEGGPRSGIEVVLEDSGIASDPDTWAGRPLDQVRPGGLGLHFIRESMDKVEFTRENGKNQLRMVKYLYPRQQGSKPEGE